MRIDGRDAFINRLGRWDDPVAVAKAHAIVAQIWSDYQQGVFDRSLMAYQPLVNGKQVGLLEALRVRAESKRQEPPSTPISCWSNTESPSAPEVMQRHSSCG